MDTDNENELDTWLRSHEYLRHGAGEDEIAASSTSDLMEAERLMASCERKPPGHHFELPGQVVYSLLSEGTYISLFKELILNEGFRYARVCRELAMRSQSGDPEGALALLESALLPAACSYAFEDHGSYMTWLGETTQEGDRHIAKALKLSEEAQRLVREPDKYDHDYKRRVVWDWMVSLVDVAVYNGIVEAAFAIGERQDAWNFSIKASMVALEERLGHSKEARRLKDQCLDLISINDDLWSEVFDKTLEKWALVMPPTVRTAPGVTADLETALASALDSKLAPLMASVQESLKVSHALHSRLDLVVEKLIDLNQRSELTWQHISKLAAREPDYDDVRRSIEASLACELAATWGQLEPESGKDLVDAEYVLKQCDHWGSGWRMPVLGYCTVAERELRASYKVVEGKLFSIPDTGPRATKTLGDLIEALERLGSWSKTPSPALKALLERADLLRRLNTIRIRSAHPTDKEVSRDEADWVRRTLLSPLLAAILAVRLK